MAGTSKNKITPDLAQQLEHADPGQRIEVIVELEPPLALPASGSRAQRMAILRENFDQTLASVARRVAPTGGKILESAWINSTLRAELTPDQIDKLEDEQLVRSIDSPRHISVEA
jgi:hypothetical protein